MFTFHNMINVMSEFMLGKHDTVNMLPGVVYLQIYKLYKINLL